MDRFFLPPDAWDGAVFLGEEESHHALRVLRKKEGQEVVVFDGVGREARARLGGREGGRVRLSLGEVVKKEGVRPRLRVAVGLPKGKIFDGLLAKSVELGVAEIVPLVTQHGELRMAEAQRRHAKWQRLVLEACKQCGQNWLPRLAAPCELGDWLETLPVLDGGSLRLMGCLEAAVPTLGHHLAAGGAFEEATVLVGPEGDLSAAEYEAARAVGFVGVSLGELVLRVETAAVMMLSVLRAWPGAERGGA